MITPYDKLMICRSILCTSITGISEEVQGIIASGLPSPMDYVYHDRLTEFMQKLYENQV